MRILIVEDDKSLCAAARTVLERSGHETACVGAMSRCAHAVANFDPELVILDLRLPDSQGTETMEAMSGLTSAPIVVFSAEEMWEDECLRLGAMEYLVKGEFTPMDLPEAVSRAANRCLLARALDRHDRAVSGEESWPGQPTTSPGKVAERLLSLADEIKRYASG